MRKVRTFSNDKELVSQRRDHIVKVATSLIAKKGYNRINTRELATALGMSTGGLYHYIGSKEDILYLIINFTSDLTSQVLEKFSAYLKDVTPIVAIIESVRIYLETIDNYRDFHNFLNHVMLSLSINDRKIIYQAESRVVEYFENLLSSGVEKGEFEIQDVKIVAHNIIAIAHTWANRGWYLKRYYTLERYIKEEIAILLQQITKLSPKSIEKTIARYYSQDSKTSELLLEDA
jgi:AcrR family transcriptional regulator